jgi:hypothetical protein
VTGVRLARPPVLGSVSAADLTLFGVHPEIAASLVKISDEDQLLSAADVLPGAQAEAVLDLAAGCSPEQVWADFAWADAAPDADVADIAGTLARPLARLSFTSLDHDADLQAALEGPSYQGCIGVESRSSQMQRPVPPGQAQPHRPHTAELAVCD